MVRDEHEQNEMHRNAILTLISVWLIIIVYFVIVFLTIKGLFKEETPKIVNEYKPSVTVNNNNSSVNGKGNINGNRNVVSGSTPTASRSRNTTPPYTNIANNVNTKPSNTNGSSITSSSNNNTTIYNKFSISTTNLLLKLGETKKVSATGGNGVYTYRTSNLAVATVDNAGNVKGVGLGTAVITIYDGIGNYGYCNVRVENSPSKSLIITPGSATLKQSDTLQLGVSGGNGEYTWSTSNDTIATVSTNGLVTGRNTIGTVTITAKDSLGNYGECTINVIANPLTFNIIPRGDIYIKVGNTLTISYEGGSVRELYTSNMNIVDIDLATNKLIAKSPGIAVITAKDANGNISSRVVYITAN